MRSERYHPGYDLLPSDWTEAVTPRRFRHRTHRRYGPAEWDRRMMRLADRLAEHDHYGQTRAATGDDLREQRLQ